MERSIAFICNYSWVGMSSSVINSAIFWESKGYCVDIYCERPDIKQFPLPSFHDKNISFIITVIEKKPIINDIYFYKKYFIHKSYKYLIGVDHKGIIRAMIVSLFIRSRIIYHSLEFYEIPQFNLKSLAYKLLEMISAKRAKYIFTQDDQRQKFLQHNLYQNKKKFRLVYNSPTGDIIKVKSNYFRKKYRIGESKKIVLAIGSIIREHYIIELITSFQTWDEKFVLVIHGWFPDEQLRKIINQQSKKYPSRIFISDYFFENSDKYIPFTSCDIGFVGFKPMNKNMLYAAGSAGKLFDFMRCGVPIVAYRTPGMSEIVDDRELGVSFVKPGDIKDALRSICNKEQNFIKNCYSTFSHFEFNRQYQKVISTIY